MQLLKAPKDALLKPLQTVVGIIENATTMPILHNVLLEKKGTEVTFISSNLEVQITTHATIGVGDESVATAVPGHKLHNILRALSDQQNEVDFAQSSGDLTIRSGGSSFQLKTLEGHDFPRMKAPENAKLSVSLPQKTLFRLLSQVHFAMADRDIRYYLNGLLLEFTPNRLTAVATDGHRLAYASTALELHVESPCNAIIPRKAVLELQRLIDENSDELVTIILDDRVVQFSFGDVELLIKLIDGRYPDFRRVIPTNHTIQFNIPREQLLSALRRVLTIADKKDTKGVKLHFGPTGLHLKTENANNETSEDLIPLSYGFDEFNISFQSSYFIDVLAMLKDQQEIIWSSIPEASSSVMIKVADNPDFCYVVMPMRV